MARLVYGQTVADLKMSTTAGCPAVADDASAVLVCCVTVAYRSECTLFETNTSAVRFHTRHQANSSAWRWE
jgi:hypothetical protein